MADTSADISTEIVSVCLVRGSPIRCGHCLSWCSCVAALSCSHRPFFRDTGCHGYRLACWNVGSQSLGAVYVLNRPFSSIYRPEFFIDVVVHTVHVRMYIPILKTLSLSFSLFPFPSPSPSSSPSPSLPPSLLPSVSV